jgi:hypothetical protein
MDRGRKFMHFGFIHPENPLIWLTNKDFLSIAGPLSKP